MFSNQNPDENQKFSACSTVIDEPVGTLQIAVCDDEASQLQMFMQLFNTVKVSAPLHVEYFTTAETLLENLDTRRKNGVTMPDIIFTDIKMSEMDGITFGKKLQNISRDIYLVLFTAYPEYAIQGYEVRAFRYLLKPIAPSDIEQTLGAILKERSRQKKLLVQTAEAEYMLPLSDITYLSSEDKYTVLYTTEGHYIDRTSLNSYEQILDSYGFCRIHRKHLVNLTQHKHMEKGRVSLLDGTKLPISRRRESIYRAKLLQFLGEDLLT